MYSLYSRGARALILAVFVTLIFLAGTQVSHADGPIAAQSTPGATVKDPYDKDPHIPLTPAQAAGMAQKDQAARAHYLTRPQTVSPNSMYYGRYLPAVQQPQGTDSNNKSYYCGPASVSELLNYLHPNTSQADASYWLNTTSIGTGFSGWDRAPAPYYTAYPVSDVLNYKRNTVFYYPVWVSDIPSPGEISTFIVRMTSDLDGTYPLVGDADEPYNWPHLPGHPNSSQTIYHWFTINGYYVNGNQTDYLDSATSVWSTVQAYNFYFDTNTLVQILGGRGYVW